MDVYFRIPTTVDLEVLAVECMHYLRDIGTGILESLAPVKVEDTEEEIIKVRNRNNLSEYILGMNRFQIRSFSSVRYFIGTFLSKLSRIDYKKDKLRQMFSTDLEGLYKHYDKVIDFSQSKGIVLVDESYMNQMTATINVLAAHPKAYGLSEAHLGDYKKVVADKKVYSRRVGKILRREFLPDKSHTSENIVSYQLRSFLREYEINMPDVDQWSTYVDIGEDVFLALAKLKQGVLNLTRSGKVGRYHSILTQMPKEARQFIRHRTQGEFHSCDVVASHFTLLCGVLDFDKEAFQKHIANDFYASISSGKFDRESIKAQSFRYLFGSNFKYNGKCMVETDRDIDRCMKEALPDLHDYISTLSKKEKTKLAQELMRLESELIVRGVGGILMDKQIPFYTVHDCIMTTGENVSFVIQTMEEVIFKAIGIKPRIKTSYKFPTTS